MPSSSSTSSQHALQETLNGFTASRFLGKIKLSSSRCSAQKQQNRSCTLEHLPFPPTFKCSNLQRVLIPCLSLIPWICLGPITGTHHPSSRSLWIWQEKSFKRISSSIISTAASLRLRSLSRQFSILSRNVARVPPNWSYIPAFLLTHSICGPEIIGSGGQGFIRVLSIWTRIRLLLWTMSNGEEADGLGV